VEKLAAGLPALREEAAALEKEVVHAPDNGTTTGKDVDKGKNKVPNKVSRQEHHDKYQSIEYCEDSTIKSHINSKYISPFKDRHNGARGLLLCYGKSLDKYRHESRDNFIVAGNNLAFKTGVPIHYLFIGVAGAPGRTDTSYMPNMKIIDEYKCIHQKFYFQGIGSEAAKRGNAILYEHRKDVKFQRDVGKHPFGLRYSKTQVHAVAQFLLYTGIKSLTLVGCDAANNGYANRVGHEKGGMQRYHDMQGQWKIFKSFMEACYPTVNVTVLNPVGLKGLGWNEVYTYNGTTTGKNVDKGKNKVPTLNSKLDKLDRDFLSHGSSHVEKVCSGHYMVDRSDMRNVNSTAESFFRQWCSGKATKSPIVNRVRKVKNRYDLVKQISAHNMTGWAAELGVAHGGYSKYMLDNKFEKVVSIDFWQHPDRRQSSLQILGGEKTKGRSCMLWGSFKFSASYFSDGMFDFIYIDGFAKTNSGIHLETLESWFPKVRDGGIIAGHDYDKKYPTVIEAVNKFALRHKLEIHVVNATKRVTAKEWDCCNSWWASVNHRVQTFLNSSC